MLSEPGESAEESDELSEVTVLVTFHHTVFVQTGEAEAGDLAEEYVNGLDDSELVNRTKDVSVVSTEAASHVTRSVGVTVLDSDGGVVF